MTWRRALVGAVVVLTLLTAFFLGTLSGSKTAESGVLASATPGAKLYAHLRVIHPAKHWPCLETLWARESGWNVYANNPSSSAYGIPQALPGAKMAAYGRDWRTSYRTQIQWGLNYIWNRYGSMCRAKAHSDNHGWY